MKNIGKAYGFFDCNASTKEIEAELPIIRDIVQIPSELELSLMEGMDELEGDSDLMEIARISQEAGLKYIIEANYPDRTNGEAKKVLRDLLNGVKRAYPSLRGEIFHKESGEYVRAE